MARIGQMQLGKQGLTENFIGALKHHFDRNTNVRVSVLKSAGHDKAKVKEYSKTHEELREALEMWK